LSLPAKNSKLRFADPAKLGDVHQAAQGFRLLPPLFVRQLQQVEVTPITGLVLAAVPGEELGVEPARLLLLGSFGWLRRDILGQPFLDFLNGLCPVSSSFSRYRSEAPSWSGLGEPPDVLPIQLDVTGR